MEDGGYFSNSGNGLEPWAHELGEYELQGKGQWREFADTYNNYEL